jgi:PAS domain S-box-containing protein
MASEHADHLFILTQQNKELKEENRQLHSLEQQNKELKEKIRQLEVNADIVQTGFDEQLAYQESQDRFRTVFEHSRFGNKIISSDLKITQVNPAMVALLGYSSKEEIIGTRILDYAPEAYQRDWASLQQKLWKAAMPSFSLETRLIKKDGSVIWCQVTSILFPDQGEQLGYTIIEDVTEQRMLRQQKEEFISVASHELKTPITSLKATLQMLTRLLVTENLVPEKVKKLAQSAQVLTQKITHLVDDLLSLTKIEQGQLSLKKTQFKVSEVLESCCNHLPLDGKHYVTHLGDLSIAVNADQFKLDQVLINLVNNAVKYAPDSQEIIIHAEQQNGQTRITVSDRGPGIPAEDLPHLFERYYRVNKTENRIFGIGLGLYISSEIIRTHGGEMGVNSELGNGASFWFTIPE